MQPYLDHSGLDQSGPTGASGFPGQPLRSSGTPRGSRQRDGLRYYKIGLLVLGIFAIGLVILTLTQAGKAKQDTKTSDAAQSIATKLNDYVNSNQTVPSSLTEAGIKSVPDTVTYTKQSDNTYKFCIKYQTSNIDTDVLSYWISRGMYGGMGDDTSPASPEDMLFVSPLHKKGNDCQTVKMYNYDPYYPSDNLLPE